jgi:hypothetical protein
MMSACTAVLPGTSVLCILSMPASSARNMTPTAVYTCICIYMHATHTHMPASQLFKISTGTAD